eukprot:scaffold3037_cov146-Cylindrotheca_fusiformis.AAC.3
MEETDQHKPLLLESQEDAVVEQALEEKEDKQRSGLKNTCSSECSRCTSKSVLVYLLVVILALSVGVFLGILYEQFKEEEKRADEGNYIIFAKATNSTNILYYEKIASCGENYGGQMRIGGGTLQIIGLSGTVYTFNTLNSDSFAGCPMDDRHLQQVKVF